MFHSGLGISLQDGSSVALFAEAADGAANLSTLKQEAADGAEILALVTLQPMFCIRAQSHHLQHPEDCDGFVVT